MKKQPLKIEDSERIRLLNLDNEQRATKATIHQKLQVLEALIKQVDPDGTIRDLRLEIQELSMRVDRFGAEYRKICEELSQRLGIKMNEYAFDIDTGALVPADEARKMDGLVK